ncbi:MAG: hypothetical protein OSJ67_00570 [Clostridia bacterium]|nr:hypothetical protein [Clostridia bacterium]
MNKQISCEKCANRETCTRDTGMMFGYCNVAFKPIESNEVEESSDDSRYASDGV